MFTKNLKPAAAFSLLRLGRNHDGGYLVVEASIQQADVLISMGISTDWSFEKDFFKLNPVPIQAYDHTVTPRFWRRYITKAFEKACLKGHVKRFINSVKLYRDYKRFFTNNIKHVKKMIGVKSQGGLSMKDIMQGIDSSKTIFFKIDIEGSEYRILNELLEYSSRICGLAIEFHDVDLHRERIEAFIKSFPLTMVHVHPNNFGGVDANGDPLVIEVSFANTPTRTGAVWKQPHPLDQPCDPNAKDLNLIFSA